MKIRNLLSVIASVLVVGFSVTSCGTSGDTDEVTYLHVYNWQDYIYQNDPENGYEEDDMTIQFENYINGLSLEEKAIYGLTTDIKVIYDTFDTPETMYNELKLNKTSYDLFAPSDYMIQKLALNLDGLSSTRLQKVDFSKVPNYTKYVSPFLTDTLKNVAIDDEDPSKGSLNDYAVGYMWGTLGLIYNPGAATLSDYTEEQVIDDFSSPDAWNLLWENDDYARIASIKDSIRDTYSMGIMHVYNDEFAALQKKYENAEITKEEYKYDINNIFNRSDSETVAKVQAALIELKDRIYGFEVDTGKTDIVTGKVGINLAWSGDAVYSMDQAEEYDQYFYYALPSYGANIWFDGWCIPESCTGQHLAATYAFLDFLSMPQNAAMNMDYIGYTPFIAGDEVLSVVHEWYDAEDQSTAVAYDLSYFFDGTLVEGDPVIMTDEEQTKRQLHAQYPEESEIDHLCIMKDFGRANDSIVTMWENVKVNPLPTWVTVIVILAIVGVIGYLGSYQLIRKAKLKRRKELRKKE